LWEDPTYDGFFSCQEDIKKKKNSYVCQEIGKERLWEEIEIGDFVHIPLKMGKDRRRIVRIY